MYAGRPSADDASDDIVYFATNAYWGRVDVELPGLPAGYIWSLCVDTGRAPDKVIAESENLLIRDRRYSMQGRSVIVCAAKKVFG